MNNRCFENYEKTLEELISFNTSYLWIVVYVAPLVISYNNSFVLFALLPKWLLLYTSYVLESTLCFK